MLLALKLMGRRDDKVDDTHLGTNQHEGHYQSDSYSVRLAFLTFFFKTLVKTSLLF